MRIEERGIGNMAFIAVLILLLIATALMFVFKDKADSTKASLDARTEQVEKSDQKLAQARSAYDALREIFGTDMPELRATDESYPDRNTIHTTVRKWLWTTSEDIRKNSQAKVRPRQFVFTPPNTVKVTPGDPMTIELYGSPFVDSTIDVNTMLAPLASQFKYAASVVEDNNRLFEEEFTKYGVRIGELDKKVKELETKYATDVTAKGQSADQFQGEAAAVRDQVNQLTAQLDTLQSQSSTRQQESDKTIRTLKTEKTALENRIRAIKHQIDVAMKEDKKDGEVLVADARTGLVFINLGRQRKVGPGMRFTVWRAGKGNVREDIAVIRVVSSDDSKSTCRILEAKNTRVPVAAGMNVSNPFYDPNETLRVYIYGNLQHYTTDLAKRRLAESGAVVVDTLDDSVKVIVLGEPVLKELEEAAADEDGAAMADRRASMEKQKAIEQIMRTATTIGAVVVTEDVLRTFIQY
jgi:hypothetical protein